MRTKIVSLDVQFEEMYANSLFSRGDDNRTNINKMKDMVQKAMKCALTKRQRECLTMYYFEHMNINEIADKTGLHKSTVSRHINAAKNNLRKLNAFIP